MNNPWIILLIMLVVIVVILGLLALFGSKMQKKQAATQEQMRQAAQQVSMLIIDKKKMKLCDANLPKIVMEQTPKYLRKSKVPIVKVKAGPQVINMMCDAQLFDQIPVKKEVKALVSGIYIVEIKSVRGGSLEKPKTKAQLKEEKKAAKKEEKKASKKDAKEVEKKVSKASKK